MVRSYHFRCAVLPQVRFEAAASLASKAFSSEEVQVRRGGSSRQQQQCLLQLQASKPRGADAEVTSGNEAFYASARPGKCAITSSSSAAHQLLRARHAYSLLTTRMHLLPCRPCCRTPPAATTWCRLRCPPVPCTGTPSPSSAALRCCSAALGRLWCMWPMQWTSGPASAG